MIKRAADRFFRWFCHPDFYADIQGDLEELYQRNRARRSARYASWKLCWQVVMLFRPSLIRPFSPFAFLHPLMLRNYLTIGSRHLLRHKLFTSINVAGLALGLAAFLLMQEYVRFEKSYDRFFAQADQLYRLSTIQVVNGSVGVKDAMSYYPAGRVLVEELPEVLMATTSLKFDESGPMVFRKGDQLRYEKGVVSADSNFLYLLNYRVLKGSRETMLSEPNTLVLTERKAHEYFGEESALGQVLEVNHQSFTVTGVIEDVPDNTHYKFEILMSDKSLQDRADYNSWNSFNYYTFVRLAPHTDLAALDPKLERLVKKYRGAETSTRFALSPVQSLHLHSGYTFEPELPGSAKAVSFVQLIAVFMLIIAWVNYINLSTARAVERAKEVGLRKVIGAYPSQLMGQFLFEALLVNLLASLLALLLAELALPFFNQLVGKTLVPHLWNHPPFLRSLLVFFLIGSLVSGFYPALVLSALKPTTVLKGKFRHSRRGIWLRKSLVVVQFASSMVLIAGTFIVYRQVQYMQGRDLGIDTDYVVGLTLPDAQNPEEEQALASKIEAFKEDLRKHAAIEVVGGTSNLPGGDATDINSTSSSVRIVGKTDRLEGTYYMQYNDDHFLDAVGMQLLMGRDFELSRASDSSAVLVNEAFLRRINVADPLQALEEYLQFGTNENNEKHQIVGIVRDFNRTTLKSAVEPTIYFYYPRLSKCVVKLQPEHYREGLGYLETTWTQFFPNTPLDYTFLDERFAALYEQDRRFVEVFGSFSGLAIFIAMLGLFGLASFMAVQRTKEVGVRKVLGATIPYIIGSFYKDFLVLLSVAAVVGIPAVYWGMSSWLENYAFRIDFPWLLTIVALGVVAVFALATVGYQIYKVAVLNPAKTLKYE
ncbi:putative ABC transport system permease protein [Catalinimonas alkaloidigena]|uniref:Putative ABC transport system permease protein n=1 Tax=Catalinimonas alkaloidigena TaxID=1075417 RepID=A0A1G9TZ76_9BACT|nr:FtsX-like permease family protein [Catalinimonas alkaloidigena]SDM52565.1 putative ABC transport system permease protein [Catalinimonas alkaloidigena]